MNFCFVSTLEIDSIFVTFDFMAILRGLEFQKSILFVEITTSFQIEQKHHVYHLSSFLSVIIHHTHPIIWCIPLLRFI